MNSDRYGVMRTDAGFYVLDSMDDVPVGEPYDNKLGAEVEASRRNRREGDRLFEQLLATVRKVPVKAGSTLNNLVEALGKAAASCDDAEASAQLVNVAAVALRMAEDIEKRF